MKADNPTGNERLASWQKHVVEALWLGVVLLILSSLVLILAEAHGLFNRSGDKGPPPSAWPVGGAMMLRDAPK
jgi:hypothetical protein